MRKLLWFPAMLGGGLFFRNKDKVADLIDTGEWSHALIYIAFAVGGAVCAIIAMSGSEATPETQSGASTEDDKTNQSGRES